MILHKLMTKLPILLVGNSVLILLFIKNTQFYQNYYFELDKIDTVLVSMSLLHFFFYSKKYNKIEINFVLCILSIIFLTLAYYFINEQIYYYLYILIILLTLMKSYVNNRSRKTQSN